MAATIITKCISFHQFKWPEFTRNKIIHFICIPQIFISLFALIKHKTFEIDLFGTKLVPFDFNFILLMIILVGYIQVDFISGVIIFFDSSNLLSLSLPLSISQPMFSTTTFMKFADKRASWMFISKLLLLFMLSLGFLNLLVMESLKVFLLTRKMSLK